MPAVLLVLQASQRRQRRSGATATRVSALTVSTVLLASHVARLSVAVAGCQTVHGSPVYRRSRVAGNGIRASGGAGNPRGGQRTRRLGRDASDHLGGQCRSHCIGENGGSWRSRHYAVKASALREAFRNEWATLQWVESEHQIADLMTKFTPPQTSRRLRRLAGMGGESAE